MTPEIRHHLRPFITAALLTSLAASGACKARENGEQTIGLRGERDPLEQVEADERELEMTPKIAVTTPSDEEISATVERELQIDHITGFGDSAQVEVRTREGIVELTGTVDKLLAKQRATLIAEQVKGVRAVSNRITLSSEVEKIDDETLVDNVRDALHFDPAAERYELEASAEDGVVTLSGTVDSWAERQLSERIARSIRGVRELDSQIRVDPPEERSDGEIEAEVEARLRWDVLVNEALIEVEVEEGKVELSGMVGSLAERRRAYADAWTTGVVDVEDDQLMVVWAVDEPELRDELHPILPEDEIRDAITDAFTYDPRVLSFKIDVEVVGSKVTLSGRVDNLKAKQAAEQVARNTLGVAHVVNDLVVAPESKISDRQIEARIESQLLINAYTSGYEVEVEVDEGYVTLRGVVDSALERAEASNVAAGVEGVIDVTNRLQVEGARGFFVDPYLYPYHPYVSSLDTYAPERTALSDELLEEQIERELRWNPYVDEPEVSVEVGKGRATLTGTVDSWHERMVSEAEAFEGGALSVNNLLNVER